MFRSIDRLVLWFATYWLQLRLLVLTLVIIVIVAGLIFPGVAAFADGATGGTHSNP